MNMVLELILIQLVRIGAGTTWLNYDEASVGTGNFSVGKGYQMATDGTGSTVEFKGTPLTLVTQQLQIIMKLMECR